MKKKFDGLHSFTPLKWVKTHFLPAVNEGGFPHMYENELGDNNDYFRSAARDLPKKKRKEWFAVDDIYKFPWCLDMPTKKLFFTQKTEKWIAFPVGFGGVIVGRLCIVVWTNWKKRVREKMNNNLPVCQITFFLFKKPSNCLFKNLVCCTRELLWWICAQIVRTRTVNWTLHGTASSSSSASAALLVSPSSRDNPYTAAMVYST